ncbi:DNA-binding response regulator [Deinococcus malanensis]|nr:DNA-binding response regulator [Deinococcus malanensis]
MRTLHTLAVMERKPLVLVIEDEKDIARFIELELAAEGYATEVAFDGVTGLSKFREVNPDLVILDLMLPVLDGLEVARRIRKTSNTPIIILTAKDGIQDKVEGLDSGADDYLIKPFSIEELLARVRAHLRRVNPAVTGEVRVADLVMNLDGREIFRGGRRVELSAKEFELLELLARNPGKVFSRFEIEEKVWPEYTGGSNVVDVYIGYLRRKLEEGGERRLIHTVRGVGYVLREE